jgi:broad specificity phosphatase PhoE
MASPYRRAIQTSQLIRDQGGLIAKDQKFCIDERLREKEFGVLDRLTRVGIEAQFPEQAEFRRLLGKFYHRPPGGESWCDVILRLRSLLDTMSLHYAGDRVMIVAHQVVVLCLRYLLESLGEEQILQIDREGDIANCGVTEYRYDPKAEPDGGLVLVRYNFTAPLEQQAARVTAEPDANVAAR